nr:hypothetical protein [Tanacetum cinerariifolium]
MNRQWSGGGSRWLATVDRRDYWKATWNHYGGDTWPSNDWYEVAVL